MIYKFPEVTYWDSWLKVAQMMVCIMCSENYWLYFCCITKWDLLITVDIVCKILFESPISWFISAYWLCFFILVVYFYSMSNQSLLCVLRTSALQISVCFHSNTVISLSFVCFLTPSRTEKMVKAAALFFLSFWFSFGSRLHELNSANSRIPSGVLGNSPNSLQLDFAGLFL